MKDKEWKQKEREIVQRGVKEKVNVVEELMVKFEEMGLGVEKEGIEVFVIVSKKDEDGGDLRKKKWFKKKVNKKN